MTTTPAMAAVRGPYRGKRLFDLAVLAVVAVPALLLGGLCALAVALTSRGPVLFTQERIGRDGVAFTAYKFRTMVHGDNPIVPDPTRITAVGRVLRRLSLDELPQLINVARGEMSIVGPRPTLAYQVDQYTPRQRGRLAVRPGLTGWAQVNGRNSLPWDQRIELDLDYVARQSPQLDLRIIVRTATVMLTGAGVEGHNAADPIVAGTGGAPQPPGPPADPAAAGSES